MRGTIYEGQNRRAQRNTSYPAGVVKGACSASLSQWPVIPVTHPLHGFQRFIKVLFRSPPNVWVLEGGLNLEIIKSFQKGPLVTTSGPTVSLGLTAGLPEVLQSIQTISRVTGRVRILLFFM